MIASDFTKDSRNATQEMVQTKTKPASVKPVAPKKPKVNKVGNVETAFFTNQSSGQQNSLRKNDSISDVAGKLFNFMKYAEDERKIHFELYRNFEQEHHDEDKKRHNELIEALKKQREKKPKLEEKKKEEEKKPEEKKEEEKKKEEKKAPEKTEAKAKEEVKKTTEKTPEPQAKPPEPKTKPAEPQAKPPEPKVKPAEPQAKPAEPSTAKPAPEAKPPVTAKPVEPAPAAPQAPTPTVTVPKPSIPSGVSTAGKVATTAVVLTAAQQSVASELEKAGFSPKAQANIFAQVQSESNFKPQSEGLNHSAQRLSDIWPNRFATKDEKGNVITPHKPNTLALSIEKNPEKIANSVYGGRMGNTEEGDGWKYRGRGYIQITGKDAYKALSRAIKVDLISNPDLLNDPVIAAKSIPWFFLSYKGKAFGINSPKDLENISLVNKAVGFQDHVSDKKTGEMESKKRERLAQQFEGLTGEKIASASKENEDLKKQGASGTTVIMDNTQTNISQSAPSKQKTLAQGSSPDLPAHQQG
jgi:predicted chitinase